MPDQQPDSIGVCPFCGPNCVAPELTQPEWLHGRWQVVHGPCGTASGHSKTAEEALATWNTRNRFGPDAYQARMVVDYRYVRPAGITKDSHVRAISAVGDIEVGDTGRVVAGWESATVAVIWDKDGLTRSIRKRRLEEIG